MLEAIEKYLTLKLVTILAITLPFVFAVLWISSATLNGQWTFGVHTLSHMGISENALAAALFNGGCMACGAMGILIGLGTAAHKECAGTIVERTGTIAGMFYAVGMFFLILVGVFPMDQKPIHYIVATLFFALVLFNIIIAAVDNRRLGRHFEIDVAFFALSLLFMATMAFPLWEALIVILIMIWTVLLGVRYIHYEGALEN